MSVPSGDASRWIARLALQPHPEGGYYRETYRAAETVSAEALPERYAGARAFSTAVYFLLPSEEISALHRLRSDELWHFHLGTALTLVTIGADGTLEQLALGPDVDRGERLQATVAAGTWFGATVSAPGSFALVSCTVAPGFDFADFELAERGALAARYPQHAAVVTRLTRGA